MTREEAARVINECKDKGFKHTFYTMNEYHAALDMAIQALEQEPCEDAISRQTAIDAFGLSEKTRKYGGDHSGYNTLMLYEIQDVIEDLPSVGSEKTGRWIEHENHGIKHIECSKCSVWFLKLHLIRNSYCPNCGAKMEGVEE